MSPIPSIWATLTPRVLADNRPGMIELPSSIKHRNIWAYLALTLVILVITFLLAYLVYSCYAVSSRTPITSGTPTDPKPRKVFLNERKKPNRCRSDSQVCCLISSLKNPRAHNLIAHDDVERITSCSHRTNIWTRPLLCQHTATRSDHDLPAQLRAARWQASRLFIPQSRNAAWFGLAQYSLHPTYHVLQSACRCHDMERPQALANTWIDHNVPFRR